MTTASLASASCSGKGDPKRRNRWTLTYPLRVVENILPVPTRLLDLVQRGVWPADFEQAMDFEWAYPDPDDTLEERESRFQAYGLPRVPVDRIQLMDQAESALHLYPPPFRVSIAWSVRDRPGFERVFAEDEIDRKRLLGIADFGQGSDKPIVLDYQHDLQCPTVLRLEFNLVRTGRDDQQRWGQHKYWDNHWVEVAPSFDEFALLLGFTE